MSLTHTWAITVKDDTGASMIVDAIVITGDVDQKINEVVTANTVKEIDINIPVADLQSFFVEASLGCTVKFNSATTPVSPSPITLTANQAYGWKNVDPGTNPLTVNITKIYIDNTANPTKACTFKAGFLLVEGV